MLAHALLVLVHQAPYGAEEVHPRHFGPEAVGAGLREPREGEATEQALDQSVNDFALDGRRVRARRETLQVPKSRVNELPLRRDNAQSP